MQVAAPFSQTVVGVQFLFVAFGATGVNNISEQTALASLP